MKQLTALAVLPLLAGCLTSAPPSVATWTIAYAPARAASSAVPAEGAPRGSVRIAQVVVRAPYDIKTRLRWKHRAAFYAAQTTSSAGRGTATGAGRIWRWKRPFSKA